jgi:hypothetical protein
MPCPGRSYARRYKGDRVLATLPRQEFLSATRSVNFLPRTASAKSACRKLVADGLDTKLLHVIEWMVAHRLPWRAI